LIVPEFVPGPVPTKFAVQVVEEDGNEAWIATPVEALRFAPPPSRRLLPQDANAFPETTP
jgi:hypothetical protein